MDINFRLPHWVPPSVYHYLAHTEAGLSIRELAREFGMHPSTVLRQVRRFEARRDDPLIDDALMSFTRTRTNLSHAQSVKATKMVAENAKDFEAMSQEEINKKALPILRRLCEPGAVLAVAREMELAVVVREDGQGGSLRTASVSREVAQAMALQAWISASDPSVRIVRYFITTAGRSALRELTAQGENRAHGFREMSGATGWDKRDDTAASRYLVTESPLVGLARRKDRDGQPFLAAELVLAGERMREDWELSFISPEKAAIDWRKALEVQATPETAPATIEARLRVTTALDDLGPGLADVILHCCCLLNGLESTEKTFGWSARSGKIVLRIALQRLNQHYLQLGKYRPLIG